MTTNDKTVGDERAAFEAWGRSQNWFCSSNSFGEYTYETERAGWEAWQARASLTTPSKEPAGAVANRDALMKLSQFAHTAAHMSENDMRNNLSSIADELIALAAPGAAIDAREQEVRREFTNELGNSIRITIEGPTSVSENVLTPMEAEQLRGALNDHAEPEVSPVATEELNWFDPMRGGFVKRTGDDFSNVKPPMCRIAGVNPDVLRRAAMRLRDEPPAVDAGEKIPAGVLAAIRDKGLALLKTERGYMLMALGQAVAQSQESCQDAPAAAGAAQAGLTDTERDELNRLRALINTPHTEDWMRSVDLEAAHQIERWGEPHDAGKAPTDWLFLLGYLGGKAATAFIAGDAAKGKHHIISSGAVLLNWWRHVTGESTAFRPGHGAEAVAALAATPAPEVHSPATVAQPVAGNEKAVYAIIYDDTDRPHEIVIGEAGARHRFSRISQSWNAHLFGKIESNSRDDRHALDNIAQPCPSQGCGGAVSKEQINRAIDAWFGFEDEDTNNFDKRMRAALAALSTVKSVEHGATDGGTGE